MKGMLAAEPAVLLGLHPVGMKLLVLGQIVVTLLALCTCHSDLDTHNFHLLGLYLRDPDFDRLRL